MDFARSASFRSIPTVPVSSAPRRTAQPRWWALPESQTEPAARLLSALRHDAAVWSEESLNLEDQEEAAVQRGSRSWELMWAERLLHTLSLNVCTNLLMASGWCRGWIYCLYISEAEMFMSLWASPGSTPGGRLRSCWGVWKEVKLRLSVISTTAGRKKHPKLILFVYNHVLVDMWQVKITFET